MTNKVVLSYCHKYKGMGYKVAAAAFRKNIEDIINGESIKHMSDEGFMEHLAELLNTYNAVLQEIEDTL